METDKKEIFNRTQRLLGEEIMQRIATTRIAIFGIGGVGSWAAETLVRTGIQNLTIIDADNVSATNINRQAEATVMTVGEIKTEAMKRRLLEINPDAKITPITARYTADTADSFDLEQFDYIIDAIDSLADKALLILNATRAKQPKLLSSMGAALKLDPTRISTAEFWNVKGCPLAAALRRRFKKNKIFPARKFRCVFSDELLPNLGEASANDPSMTFNKAAVNGSLCHITATFGIILAGLIIQDIAKK